MLMYSTQSGLDATCSAPAKDTVDVLHFIIVLTNWRFHDDCLHRKWSLSCFAVGDFQRACTRTHICGNQTWLITAPCTPPFLLHTQATFLSLSSQRPILIILMRAAVAAMESFKAKNSLLAPQWKNLRSSICADTASVSEVCVEIIQSRWDGRQTPRAHSRRPYFSLPFFRSSAY